MPAFFTLGPPISPASSQRLKSPVSRFSTFVIDAPRSARKSAENGPWISCAISIIFIPSSGLLICFDTPGACGASGEVRGLSFAGRRTSSCLKYPFLLAAAFPAAKLHRHGTQHLRISRHLPPRPHGKAGRYRAHGGGGDARLAAALEASRQACAPYRMWRLAPRPASRARGCRSRRHRPVAHNDRRGTCRIGTWRDYPILSPKHREISPPGTTLRCCVLHVGDVPRDDPQYGLNVSLEVCRGPAAAGRTLLRRYRPSRRYRADKGAQALAAPQCQSGARARRHPRISSAGTVVRSRAAGLRIGMYDSLPGRRRGDARPRAGALYDTAADGTRSARLRGVRDDRILQRPFVHDAARAVLRPL